MVSSLWLGACKESHCGSMGWESQDLSHWLGKGRHWAVSASRERRRQKAQGALGVACRSFRSSIVWWALWENFQRRRDSTRNYEWHFRFVSYRKNLQNWEILWNLKRKKSLNVTADSLKVGEEFLTVLGGYHMHIIIWASQDQSWCSPSRKPCQKAS